jgi:predicted TIM-barrel fold metal-dependent hydrolase
MANNLLAMVAKAQYPGRCYAFGGLHHDLPGAAERDRDPALQARMLIEAGCDGIKMLEGKPNLRKRLGLRLNDPSLDGFYDYMQSQGRPILSHSCDPDICWDRRNCPEAFRRAGYFYADEPFLAAKEIRSEVESVLKRFPQLTMIMAHFFSLAEDIEAARRFLDAHPNALLDLAPGGDMYVAFAKNPRLWREFFTTYQDRIVLGSDNSFPDQESMEHPDGGQTAANRGR